MINLESEIHTLKHETQIGQTYQRLIGAIGVTLIRAGRRVLMRQGAHCTWCGGKPGFDSTISSRGTRCNSCLYAGEVYGRPIWLAVLPSILRGEARQ